MSNIISILILIPGEKGGECDRRYMPTIQELRNRCIFQTDTAYIDKNILVEPVVCFLYRKKTAYTHSGYMKFEDIIYHVERITDKKRSQS